MKKLLALVIVVVLSLPLVACGGNAETPAGTQSGGGSSQVATGTAEWKTFLKEYEEWVDDYVALVKKYKANPTDTSILTDYTNMANKLSEWTAKLDKVENELANDTAALAEYTKEVARIAKKLSAVQ